MRRSGWGDDLFHTGDASWSPCSEGVDGDPGSGPEELLGGLLKIGVIGVSVDDASFSSTTSDDWCSDPGE